MELREAKTYSPLHFINVINSYIMMNLCNSSQVDSKGTFIHKIKTFNNIKINKYLMHLLENIVS